MDDRIAVGDPGALGGGDDIGLLITFAIMLAPMLYTYYLFFKNDL